jgi:hypothetical protein
MSSKTHFKVGRAGTPRYCLGCSRRLVFGDRCPPCQQRLRERKRRKPR